MPNWLFPTSQTVEKIPLKPAVENQSAPCWAVETAIPMRMARTRRPANSAR